MVVTQNWNNLLSYIKLKLGMKVNKLEFSDDEIINNIKSHTLPLVSQYEPHNIWIVSDFNRDKVLGPTGAYGNQSIRIPIDTIPFEITEIEEVYYSNLVGYNLSNLTPYFVNPVDIAISNTFVDIFNFLQPVQTFTFIRPDILKFGLPITSDKLIIKLNVIHQDVSTLPSDIYNKIFKNLALRDTVGFVLANRQKYSNLQTPFGEVNLNVDALSALYESLDSKLIEELELIPTKSFLEIF
jgi:hypothetical protein